MSPYSSSSAGIPSSSSVHAEASGHGKCPWGRRIRHYSCATGFSMTCNPSLVLLNNLSNQQLKWSMHIFFYIPNKLIQYFPLSPVSCKMMISSDCTTRTRTASGSCQQCQRIQNHMAPLMSSDSNFCFFVSWGYCLYWASMCGPPLALEIESVNGHIESCEIQI